MPQPASAVRRKKAIPGTVQFNTLIAGLPEKREKIKAQIQVRTDLLESQKRVNYKNEFEKLQGNKRNISIRSTCKLPNARITKEGS